jgi:hypothetical protein
MIDHRSWLYSTVVRGAARAGGGDSVHIDEEGIGFRTWPWIAWKYGLQGCVYWEFMYNGQSKDPWMDPDSTTDPGKTLNGTGYLCYPAKPGVPEPIPSIRLKSFRRGSQDYEYL